eukprot:6213375-Pleurochrysis_carterae.AAC.2
MALAVIAFCESKGCGEKVVRGLRVRFTVSVPMTMVMVCTLHAAQRLREVAVAGKDTIRYRFKLWPQVFAQNEAPRTRQKSANSNSTGRLWRARNQHHRQMGQRRQRMYASMRVQEPHVMQ